MEPLEIENCRKMPSPFKLSVFIGLAAVALYAIRKYSDGGVCESKARLDGKTVVITGGNTGIGKETAIDLVSRGAKVIIGCRSKERGEAALVDIKNITGSDNVHMRILDLASFASIHAFAQGIVESEPRLDILINNAGIMMCPFWKTEEGFEMQVGVNHIGHFLLTNLLLDLIKKSAPSRIINVSSMGHKFVWSVDFETMHKESAYSSMGSYGVSKLANVLFTKELSQRLEGSGVSVFALHPGAVATELGRYSFTKYSVIELLMTPVQKLAFKNSKQGAQTSICCAVEEGIEKYSGQYFADCKVAPASSLAEDKELAKKLWDQSIKWTKL